MRTARIDTPSRLHFGLIDLTGRLGRIDGSVGLALEKPGFVLEARLSDRTEAVGAGPHRERAERLASTLLSVWGKPRGASGVHLRFEETIPAHIGLGSGTQAALSVIHAVAALCGEEPAREEAARLSGRGGASGIGFYGFYEGGFLVDGGHRYPSQKSDFLPSAASPECGPGPLLLRRDFPDWETLLVSPRARQVSGEEEKRLFRSRCPMPPRAAERLSHLLTMRLLPALAEEDLPEAAAALDAMGSIGWKKVEWEAQEPIARRLAERLRQEGAWGVAMSSWGPTMAAYGERLEDLKALAEEEMRRAGNDGFARIVRANNAGARIEIIEPNGEADDSA